MVFQAKELSYAAVVLFIVQWLELTASIDPFSGPNFALHRFANQTPGDYDGFNATLATDGNTDNDFVAGSCSHTNGFPNTPATWTVYFENPIFVKGIVIYNRKTEPLHPNLWTRLKNFEIYGNSVDKLYSDSDLNKYNNLVIKVPVTSSKAYSSVTIKIPTRKQWEIDKGLSYLTLCEVQVYAVSCENPTLSEYVHVINSQANYIFGTSVTFECERGYQLYGNQTITCIEDMTWSSSAPACRPKRCENPGSLNNGQYIASEHCNINNPYYMCTIQALCNTGFKLETEIYRICDENGQWTMPVPVCMRVTCDYPGFIQNIQYFHENNEHYTFGTVESETNIEARCDVGYIINGSNSLTCTLNGTWNKMAPRCDVVRCNILDLTKLSNGNYIVNGQPVNRFYAIFNESLEVVCETGYRLSTDTKYAVCMSDGNWSTKPSECKIVTCIPPTETIDIKFKTWYNTSYGIFTNALPFGAKIEAICQNGILKGGSTYRNCKENGSWDGFEPVCVSLCGAPEAINGKLIDDNNTLRNVYEAGQSLIMTCFEGFESKLGQKNLTCQPDHSWSFLPECTKIEVTGSESSLSAVIGGAGGGSVVIVLAVVVIIVIYKKRSLLSKFEGEEKAKKYTGLQNTNSATGEYAEIFESVVIREDTRAEGRPNIGRPEETSFQSSNGVYSNTETGSTNDGYYSFSTPDRIPKGAILVKHLSDIVLNDETALKRFKSEFETFPEGLTEKHTEAIKLRNRGKNRYRNMYAYDETRVVLQKEHEEESDYINACYIHGFQEMRAYIASQGPTTEIMVDFWKMIWQTESSKIVMLTKLVEEDKAKCDQYWPETGSRQFGHVTVSLESTDIYSDFTLRTFELKKDDCKGRTVTQFHYTAWPDKGVPKYSSSLVQFRNKVVNFPSYGKGPIVVHCSAGVGRTGTFIALDFLTKQAQETGYVDVVGTVMALRKQRVNLVQTVEQYALIHHALVETLMLSTSALPSSKFPEAYQDLLKIDRNTGKKKICLEFEMLKKLSPVIIEDQYVSAKYVRNRNKNRYPNVLPVEDFMPCLSVEKSRDDGYINAVFLPSYKEKRAFIITQTPLESTKEDFWKLVWVHNVHSIVMMNHISEMEQNEIYWPENGKECEAGRITVSLNGITTIEHNAVASMTIEFSEERRCVKQIQCGGWPSEQSLPSSPKVILSIMELVQSWQQQTGNKNVLVHCMNGTEKSGLYCVVSAVIDRMKIEQDVAISHVIQDMRNAREQIIPSAEQYQFCHEAVLAYIQQNETYSNFTL